MPNNSTSLNYDWWRRLKDDYFFDKEWFKKIFEREPRFAKLINYDALDDDFHYENMGKIGLVLWHEPDGNTIRPVGLIAYLEDSKRTIFCYHPDYVSDKKTPPISHTLPKSLHTYECHNDKALLPFFDNLVTDGTLAMAQENACRQLDRLIDGVTEKAPDTKDYSKVEDIAAFEKQDNAQRRFERMITFGRGFHGAVSIVDVALPDNVAGWEEGLVENDLQSLSSIGGTHPKALGIKTADGYQLAPRQVNSTHILKFEDPSFGHLVENEYMNFVASSILLPHDKFPAVELTHVGNPARLALAVERFDRTPQGGRKHFEELLQIARKSSSQRGEQSVYDLANWIRGMCDSKDQEKALMRVFFQRIITQWLLGNTDGHAKNFGLWMQDGQVAFTPNYDLVSSDLYNESILMLPISMDKYLICQVRPEHVAKLGKCLGFHDLKEVDAMVQDVLSHKDEALQALKNLPTSSIDSNFKQKFISAFEKRCEDQYKNWDTYVKYNTPGHSARGSHA